MQRAIHRWPELPPLPPPGRPVIIRLRISAVRAQARAEVRTVLRQALARWSGLLVGQLPLQETLHGPAWIGELQGRTLDISLSYANTEGWIALLRGGPIGIDVMKLEPVPEAAAIAKTYFCPAECAALRNSDDPVSDFARAWTRLEACCKCLKRGLAECSEANAIAAAGCVRESLIFEGRLAVAVATAPQRSS